MIFSVLSESKVFVNNPRKLFIAPDDDGILRIYADISSGSVQHLVKLTTDCYEENQILQIYNHMLQKIQDWNNLARPKHALMILMGTVIKEALDPAYKPKYTYKEAAKIIGKMWR